MAKFCRYCGRQLGEGEVCNCTRQNQGSAGPAGRPVTGQQPRNGYGNQRGGAAYNGNGNGRMPNGSGVQGGGYPPNGNGRMQNGSGAQGGGYIPNGNDGGRNTAQNAYGSQDRGYGQNTYRENLYQEQDVSGYGNINPNESNNYGYANMGVNGGNGKVTIDFSSLFQYLFSIIKDPVGAAMQLCSHHNYKPGLIMVVINLVVYAMMNVVFIMQISKDLYVLRGLSDIMYKLIFIGVLIIGMNYFLMAGTLSVTTKAFFNVDTSFSQMISIIGVKAVLDMLVSLLVILCLWLNSAFGLIVMILGILYTFLVLVFAYGEIVHLGGTKKVYAFLISVVCTSIACAVVAGILLAGLEVDVMSMLF